MSPLLTFHSSSNVFSQHWCHFELQEGWNNNLIFMFYKWISKISLSLGTAVKGQNAIYCTEWKDAILWERVAFIEIRLWHSVRKYHYFYTWHTALTVHWHFIIKHLPIALCKIYFKRWNNRNVCIIEINLTRGSYH